MIVAGTPVPVVPCWIIGALRPGTQNRAGPGRGVSGSRSALLYSLTAFQTLAPAGSRLPESAEEAVRRLGGESGG